MSLEVALDARKAIERGERIKIKVPPKPDIGIPSSEWPRVLGSFAAAYSFKPAHLEPISKPI